MSTPQVRKIAFADTLRGLACMSVVTGHLVMTFALAPQVVTHLTGIVQATPETPTLSWINHHNRVRFGGFGVGLFFIISGFVIPISISRLDRVPFAVARLFRIVPTYAFALAFTITTLWGLRSYFGVPYEIPWKSAFWHIAFARDLLWLPSIDGITWTLEIEMKYYLVCLVLAPMLVKHDVRGLLLLSAIVTAAVYWLGPISVELYGKNPRLYAFLNSMTNCAAYMNLMWIGTVFCFHWHGQISTRLAAVSVALFAVMFLVQMHTGGQFIYAAWRSFASTYGAVLGIFTLAYARPQWFSGWRVLTFLAKISYPLYVVHGAVGYGVEQLLVHWGVNIYAAMGLAISLMIGVATLIHTFVEAPTQNLGRDLAKRLQNWQSPPIPAEQPIPLKHTRIPERIAA